jgi:prevent-host-death family protein
MKEVALSEVKDDLSRYLRQAAKEEIVITRHGKAAGVLIGFESDDDWFDYRLENDPRFLDRIAAARASLRAGRGVRLEDLDEEGAANQGAAPDRGQRRTRPRPGASRRGRGR